MFEYCPDDGAQLDRETDDLAKRAQCPDCGTVRTAGPIDWILWRLPPGARDGAMAVLRAAFERERVTAGLSTLRAVALAALVGTLVARGLGGLVGVLAGIVVYVETFEVPDRFADDEADADATWREATNVVDAAGLATLAFLYRDGLWGALKPAVSTLTTLSLPSLASVVSTGTELGLFLGAAGAGGFLAVSVGVAVHEGCHYAAFRLCGHDADVRLTYVRAGAHRIGINAGSVAPRPMTAHLPDWQAALVGAAPLVMWVPLYLALEFALPALPAFQAMSPIAAGLASGVGGGWAMTAIPSGSDFRSIIKGDHKWEHDWQTAVNEGHCPAEGYGEVAV